MHKRISTAEQPGVSENSIPDSRVIIGVSSSGARAINGFGGICLLRRSKDATTNHEIPFNI